MSGMLKRMSPGWLWRILAGAGILLLGAGGVVISTSYDARPTVAVLGGDAPVSMGAADPSDITSNNSPTLVRNPLRSDNLAVSNRIDTPRFACALNVSFDGGASWTQTPIPLPQGEEPKCFAPDLAFAADGTLHLSFVTLKGVGNVPNAVWTARSQDGGRTLSDPVRVLGPLAFQVRLATDPVNPRRLYLSWLQAAAVGFLSFPQTGNPIEVVSSEDGGVSWQPPQRASSPGRARVAAPVPGVGPRGELYVLYVDLGEDRLDYEGGHGGKGGPPYQGHFSLVLARSLDHGRSWQESLVDAGIVPIHRFVVLFPPFPAMAIDHRSGRVYAAFHDGRMGDPDVWIWSLPLGGRRWEGPTRVNDTPKHDRRWQYLPQLAVAPDGRVDVVYYDRRSDPENVMNHVSLQSSFDHGKSFAPAVRLSSRSFDSRVGFGAKQGLPDLGSRLALLSDDRRALAVWTDTRAGTVATNKQDLTRAVVAFSKPARLAQPLESALRYGGLALMLLGAGFLTWTLAGPRMRSRARRLAHG